MKSIFKFMGVCLLLAVAAFLGEVLFGTTPDADAIRELIKERLL